MNPLVIRQMVVALIIAASSVMLSFAQAQTWPAKPVRFLSTFSAGSPADALLRVMAQKMQESLGQPFVVEIQTGAGGLVGAQTVVRSAPDGYTLLHTIPTSVVATPLLMKTPPFEIGRAHV